MITPESATQQMRHGAREDAANAHALPEVVIQASKGWTRLDLRELWDYRELLLALTWRDIKVRYQQTALGASWAIIQPVLTMIILTVVFSRLMGVKSVGVPYPVFAYTALVPWLFFANSVSHASNILVEHESVITKIYFPRLLLPLSAILAGLLDLSIAFIVLIGLMLYYGISPTMALWALPLFVLLAVMTALAVSIWLSAVNVRYRDVRYAVPFITQFWFFLTPIAYSAKLVSPKLQVIYGLNPVAGVVEGFRWALLPHTQAPGGLLIASVLIVLGLLVGGLYYFRSTERTFADVV